LVALFEAMVIENVIAQLPIAVGSVFSRGHNFAKIMPCDLKNLFDCSNARQQWGFSPLTVLHLCSSLSISI